MNAHVDMAATIIPKSDQLNADDLIAGPRTITVTGIRGNDSAEQPVSIAFEGDNGKPYKPCKSMRRVMVYVWGPDAKAYVGRSMTLYCDPAVQFGGMKVGGIRISHMSHIDAPQTMALTATRAKRAPFTVQPLKVAHPVDVTALLDLFGLVSTNADFDKAEAERGAAWKSVNSAAKAALKAASDAAKQRLETAQPEATATTEGSGE